MNAILLRAPLAVFLLSIGCIQERPSVDTGADTAPPKTATDLDDDRIVDAVDGVVPYVDFVYLDQGIVASLENTWLVGWGIGGKYDYCSENLPIERFDAQVDWPEGLIGDKVRFFFPDAVEIFFGNPRTFASGKCDTSTDGGYDSWAMLKKLNGVDRAVCPNPLDGNRLGLYLMKDEDGVFAPGCSGFAVAPDENRDSDNDGTADPDDDTDNTDTGDGGNTDTGTDTGNGGGSGTGTVTLEVVTDSSWCSGTWELWAWNKSKWGGYWPGLSNPDYLATGTASALSGSIAAESGDLIWIQGECSSSWLAENIQGAPGEHVSSITFGGSAYTVSYPTVNDDPAAGTCAKRSDAYDMVCKLN